MAEREDLLEVFKSVSAAAVGRGRSVRAALADAVLAAGWRPPARTIASVEELDSLPPRAVIADREGGIWAVNELREWRELSTAGISAHEVIRWGPFTLITASPADQWSP